MLRDRVKYILICCALSFSVMFDSSYITSYPNTAEAEFRDLLNASCTGRSTQPMSPATFTWLWALVINAWFAGYVLGSAALGSVAERLGRTLPMALAGVVSALGTAVTLVGASGGAALWMALGRGVVGLAYGVGAGCLTLWLQETAAVSVRGLASSLQEAALPLGNVFGVVFGLPGVLGRRPALLVALAAFADLAAAVLALALPDSPKHLYQRSPARSRRALLFYQGAAADPDHFAKLMDEELEDRDEVSLRDIFRTRHLRRGLLIGQAALLVQNTTGIYAIFLFSSQFFAGVGMSPGTANLASVGMVGLNCVTTFVAVGLVERLGRRRLLLGTLAGLTLCLGAFVAAAEMFAASGSPVYGYVCVGLIYLYVVLFSLGPGPLPWFLLAELLPQKARSKAQGLVMVVTNMATLLLTFATLPLWSAMGALSFVPLYILPTAALTAFLWRTLPETRGREIPDIVAELSRS